MDRAKDAQDRVENALDQSENAQDLAVDSLRVMKAKQGSAAKG